MVAMIMVEYGIVLFEVLCLMILFDTFFVRRIDKHRVIGTIVLGSVLLVAVQALNIFLPPQDNIFLSALRLSVFTTVIFIFLQCAYKGKIIFKAITALLSYLLPYFVDYTGTLIVTGLGFKKIPDTENIPLTIVMVFAIKLLLFSTVCVIHILYSKLIYRNTATNISGIKWAIILSVPMISMTSIWVIFSLVPPESQMNPALLLISLGWVFLCIVVFYLVSAIARSEQIARENAVTHEKVKNSMEHATADKRNTDVIQTLCHDIQHHFTYIASLIASKNYEAAQGYAQKIGQQVFDGVQRINTNVVLVNGILNGKMEVAFAKGIGVNLQINDLSALPFADEDIVIMLSNLLDNAIEACEKVAENKYINIKFLVSPPTEIILSIRNLYNGPVVTHNDMLLTTKADGFSHGIGFSSAVSRILKYRGEYAFAFDGREFQFTAIFPLARYA